MTDTAKIQRTGPARPARAAVAIALALAVFAFGTRIPLPGLDMDALGMQLEYRRGHALEIFSIFALWVMPLLAVLIYVEIAKLVVRPLARWQTASERNAGRMELVIHIAALAIAGFQGYGVAVALETAGMTGSTASIFVPLAVASFVGSTAILIWLAGRLGLPGLGGFWLLLAVPFLFDLPREFAGWFDYARSGVVPLSSLLVIGACLAVAVATIVFANSALSRQFGQGGPAPVITTSTLLWPPFLAALVSGDLIGLLVPDEIIGDAQSFGLVHATATVLLIPLLIWFYARLLPGGPGAVGDAGTRPVLLAVAGIQMAICAGAALLPLVMNAPFYVDAGRFIVLVTVMFVISRSVTGWPERTRPAVA